MSELVLILGASSVNYKEPHHLVHRAAAAVSPNALHCQNKNSMAMICGWVLLPSLIPRPTPTLSVPYLNPFARTLILRVITRLVCSGESGDPTPEEWDRIRDTWSSLW